MKIVILDGYTLNPGDLDWAPLEALGECAVHDRSQPAEVVARCQGAEMVLTNKVVLDRGILEQLPTLKYIGVLATGYNVVDVKCAQERGIVVTNIPGYSTDSVAQHCMALMLEFCQQVGHHSRTVHSGKWSKSEDFCYMDFPLIELRNQTLGIVGYGSIGEALAKMALSFGMKILVNKRTPPQSLPEGVVFSDLETLLKQSDFISLNCPLTETTHHLINEKTLSLMKPNAFVINTGRGPLVDEAALAQALHDKKIGGAGLDVLSAEPPPSDNPLIGAPNCFITPHIAWGTQAARQRLLDIQVSNIKAFLEQSPINVVS